MEGDWGEQGGGRAEGGSKGGKEGGHLQSYGEGQLAHSVDAIVALHELEEFVVVQVVRPHPHDESIRRLAGQILQRRDGVSEQGTTAYRCASSKQRTDVLVANLVASITERGLPLPREYRGLT
jgi:hypothetical protein